MASAAHGLEEQVGVGISGHPDSAVAEHLADRLQGDTLSE